MHVNGRVIPKARMVDSKTKRNRERLVLAYIYDMLGGNPEPMTGPVMVQGYFHPTKNKNGNYPDSDAFTWHLLDCLSKAGVYLDDKQVAASPLIERMEPRKQGYMCIEIWEI